MIILKLIAPGYDAACCCPRGRQPEGINERWWQALLPVCFPSLPSFPLYSNENLHLVQSFLLQFNTRVSPTSRRPDLTWPDLVWPFEDPTQAKRIMKYAIMLMLIRKHHPAAPPGKLLGSASNCRWRWIGTIERGRDVEGNRYSTFDVLLIFVSLKWFRCWCVVVKNPFLKNQ